MKSLRYRVTAVLLLCAVLVQARDMNVIVKSVTKASSVADIDSIRLGRRYPSHTVSSFIQCAEDSTASSFLCDIDRVEFGSAEGPQDSLSYFCVDTGGCLQACGA
ncbi:MAG: hypothetical protein GF331_07355 [Chitinivibrionales bacterium]|nr:hypothetical protein [Chitinivibrionales bacterium]